MGRPENRSQLMEYFGAEQRNTVWSWCAVNEAERKVYLSVWTDFRISLPGDERSCYILQEPGWGVREGGGRSAARNDHDEKLGKILEEDYEAYGYFVEAKDRKASPREIESTKTSFVFSLEVKTLEDGTVVGYPLRRIEVR
ncbi:hypothetical protein GN155_013970 [Alcanivorax sp. ZXX171]|nr:hypothetical protein [Alcanivorax sp. ZXX171]